MATTAAPNNAKTPNDTLKAKVQTLEKRVEMLTSTHIANVALQALAEEGFPIKNKCLNDIVSDAGFTYEDDVVEIDERELDKIDYISEGRAEELIDQALENTPDEDRVNELIAKVLETRLDKVERLLSRLSDSHQQLSDAVQPHVSRDVRSEISEAGYRIAAKQVTTMVHAPLAKAISAHTDSEMAKLIIASDFGKAAIGGLLSASTEYFAGSRGLSEGHATTARELAKEFRVGAAATAGNLITSILVDQIKEVLTGAFAPKVRVVNEESADVEEEFAAQHNNQRRAAHG